MSRSSRTLSLLLVAVLSLLLMAPGCSSRRRASAGTEPPPAPPTTPETGTETETPPSPPSTGGQDQVAAQLRDAFFDFDDASLREDAKGALDGNARYMEANGGVNVVIEGHCDERGSVEYNLALGEKRARAAKDYLVAYGINASRMTTISYGKERPFDPGHSEEAWAQNRRAHFVGK